MGGTHYSNKQIKLMFYCSTTCIDNSVIIIFDLGRVEICNQYTHTVAPTTMYNT